MESRKLELLGNLTAMDKQVKELKSYVCSMFSVYPLTDRENKQQMELDKKYKNCKLIIDRMNGEVKKFDQQLLSVYQTKTKLFEEKQQSYQNRSKLYTPTPKKAESNKDRIQPSSYRRLSTIVPVDRLVPTKTTNNEPTRRSEKITFNKRQSILDSRKPPIFRADYSKDKIERKFPSTTNLALDNAKKFNATPTSNNVNNPRVVRQPRTSLCNSALLKPRSTTTNAMNIEKPPVFKIPAPIVSSGLNESVFHEKNTCAATPSRIPVAKVSIEPPLHNFSFLRNDERDHTEGSANSEKPKDQFKIPTQTISNLIKPFSRLPSSTNNSDTTSSNSSNTMLHSKFGLPKSNKSPKDNEIIHDNVSTNRNSFLPTPTGINSAYKAYPLLNTMSKPSSYTVFTPRPHLQKPKSPVLESIEFDSTNDYRRH